MIFDTHAHYYDEAFDPDRDALLSALPAKGVGLVVCPGCDLASSQASIDLAEQYDFLYAAAGLHPENLEGTALSDLDRVRALCAHEKVVAVGEIGLDYYWVKAPEARAFSREMFDAQLSLSEELDLPAIVHDRDAHRDCLDIVRAHPSARGVFHCYAGSLEDAKVLLDRGWMLSFTGNITFHNARRAPEVLAWMPLDRLMLETDAPYMAPEPYRGQRCDSSLIPLMAEKVAQCKLGAVTAQQVLDITWDNGRRFFKIGV
jgi:TatD DNase family protein